MSDSIFGKTSVVVIFGHGEDGSFGCHGFFKDKDAALKHVNTMVEEGEWVFDSESEFHSYVHIFNASTNVALEYSYVAPGKAKVVKKSKKK